MSTIRRKFSLFLLFTLIALALSGLVAAGICLMLGVLYAMMVGNPIQEKTHKASAMLLKLSIVTMGLSLNISEIIDTAKDSFSITLVTILFAMGLGILLGKLFNVDKSLSVLISGGTAICGGSAIAALAPTVKAKPEQLIVAVSIVFLLNAVGLLVYPFIGSYIELTQMEFGLWSALGIHDTSSVVGAAASYGDEALEIATTTKLARALWIIPLVLCCSYFFNNETKTKFPLFILFFVIASLIVSLIPQIQFVAPYASKIAKLGMNVSLLLIGSGFTKQALSQIRLQAFGQAILLWIFVSIFSLWIIVSF